jgi:hypothetical protein
MLMLMDGEDDEEFCAHVPGVKYGEDTAFAWVHNAGLVEGSLVYAGATPGAVLLKARWAAAHGRLPAGEVSVLEDRWGVRICGVKGYPILGLAISEPVANKGQGEDDVTVEEIKRMVAEVAPELNERVAEAEEPVRAVLEAWMDARLMRVEQDARTLEEVQQMQQRMAELEVLAGEGRAYRQELVEQAVQARVRAQGDAFDAEEYRKVLEGQALTYVRGEIAAWESTAKTVFEPGRPVGKVLSRGAGEQGSKGEKQEPGRPAGAYKA